MLAHAGGVRSYSAPRRLTANTHGTGCTLASALAALLARSIDLPSAVQDAREFVFDAIKTAPGLGGGHGPLNHGLVTGEEEAADNDSKANPFAALSELKH